MRVKTAARRLYRADIQRLTARGMGESGNARCSRCESDVSLPYWTRTPTTVRITSPPMPGRATAASAHTEAISRGSPKTCGKDDSAPTGKAPLGACGAIPDSADTRPSAITSSVATLVALPATGTPETPANGRTSGNRDAPDAPAGVDSPRPWMPATPPTTGGAPAMPNKKEKRSEGSCASTLTQLQSEGATRLVTGAATTSVTGATTTFGTVPVTPEPFSSSWV